MTLLSEERQPRLGQFHNDARRTVTGVVARDRLVVRGEI